MEVAHPVCCGIDVHQKELVACLRRTLDAGKVEKETRSFSTTMPELLALAEWLTEQRCPIVAMESTGVYWKPVYHVLSAHSLEVVVGNPRDMRQRPGRKTDKNDADWISELLAHGLVAPSFVPPPEICALRDLTRMRVQLINTRTQSKNRVHKVLEDSNIKLGSVASDLFGVSGRAMLGALIEGQRDAKELAKLARGRLRNKIPELEMALQGQFTEHHGAIIKLSLELVDTLNAQIAELDAQVLRVVEPMAAELEQIASIPGVKQTAARLILAEIGTDMSRFGSAGRLASWAGVCPGNNESAGKRRRGRANKGNRWLRRVLVECAWATMRTDTFLGETFRRLRARIGGKKAALAVAHKILVIVYNLLSQGTFYEEQLYTGRNQRMEERWKKNAVKTLQRLGFEVELVPAQA